METSINLFRSIIPTCRQTRLTLLRPICIHQFSNTLGIKQEPPNNEQTKEQGINNSRFIRNPTPKHLRHNRPARIIRVTQMQPIRQLNAPSFVMHFFNEGAVFYGYAECRHTRDTQPVGIGSVRWFSVAWAGTERCEIRRRCVGRAWRWCGRRQSLI